MDSYILSTVGLLSICTVVAIAARRIHLPYTVGLIVTGIIIALLRYKSDLALTRDFIFEVIPAAAHLRGGADAALARAAP